mmetsp:Transcript_16761/g.38780  ORF Transcript_16761/g.38780 Transcript_16761/m.38780 type:complete len:236 (+) Transcript_16761:245-952(+)
MHFPHIAALWSPRRSVPRPAVVKLLHEPINLVRQWLEGQPLRGLNCHTWWHTKSGRRAQHLHLAPWRWYTWARSWRRSRGKGGAMPGSEVLLQLWKQGHPRIESGGGECRRSHGHLTHRRRWGTTRPRPTHQQELELSYGLDELIMISSLRAQHLVHCLSDHALIDAVSLQGAENRSHVYLRGAQACKNGGHLRLQGLKQLPFTTMDLMDNVGEIRLHLPQLVHDGQELRVHSVP